MRAKIKVFLDDDAEAREEVELPIPEVPDELRAPEGVAGGHWRWVGGLPKTRIDISEQYCLAIYVVRVRSTQARKLGEVVRRGTNRVPQRPVDGGVGKGGRPEALSPSQKALANRLRDEGHTVREIAKVLEVSHTTIERAFQGRTPTSHRGGAREPVPEDKIEEISEMASAGKSTAEIVRRTGISKAQVNRILAERREALRDDPEFGESPRAPAPERKPRAHRKRAPAPFRFAQSATPEPARRVEEPLRVAASGAREVRDNGPHKCPTCGDGFASERGMHRHETVAHARAWTPPAPAPEARSQDRPDGPVDGKSVRAVLASVFSGDTVSRAASLGGVSVAQASRFIQRAVQLMDATGPAARTAWDEAMQTGQQQIAERIARELGG